MCGWIGIIGEKVELNSLKKAGDLLNSRGPDGRGERIIAGEKIFGGLSHRRLAILDPSSLGAQPMYDADSGVSIAYNGEIYNSPQIRGELEKTKHNTQALCSRFCNSNSTGDMFPFEL